MPAIAVAQALDDDRGLALRVVDRRRVEPQCAGYRGEPDAAGIVDGAARLRAAVAATDALAAALAAARAQDHLWQRGEHRKAARIRQCRHRQPPHALRAGYVDLVPEC